MGLSFQICTVLVEWPICVQIVMVWLDPIKLMFPHSLWKNREHYFSKDPRDPLAMAGSHLPENQWSPWWWSAQRCMVLGLQWCSGEWADCGCGCPLCDWAGEGHRHQDSRPQGCLGKILQGWWSGWEDHPEFTGEKGLSWKLELWLNQLWEQKSRT